MLNENIIHNYSVFILKTNRCIDEGKHFSDELSKLTKKNYLVLS